MPSNPNTQDEDFASDIIGVGEYAAETPQKKDFLPWHKPRKQFVRHWQWCKQIQKLISEIAPDNNVLRYLGLPGDDLLDLRYIHRIICEPNNLNLRFLGFNYGANRIGNGANLNISLDEVNKLPLVDSASDILGDDISQIANVQSLAFKRSKNMGPYDVINIDLCDGFGNNAGNPVTKTHYDTLMQLMTLQARRLNPWLLLLTTRTGPQHTDGQQFEILKTLYGQNLVNCPAFETLSNEVFAVHNKETLDHYTVTPKGGSNIFLVALCKWVASIVVSQVPPAKIEVKSVLGYNVDPSVGYEDLVSIAIKIEPTLTAATDRTGLANQGQPVPDECAMAIQALRRVSNLRDVDSILANDDALMTEMIAVSSSLLEEARYDVSSYEEWSRAQ